MFVTVELIALGQRLLTASFLESQNIVFPFVDSCMVGALSWCHSLQVIWKQRLS